MSSTRPRRRKFQFTLRTLLLVVLLLSVALSWLAARLRRARTQSEAVKTIQRMGGSVSYDYEVHASLGHRPRPPAWLRNSFGEDFFSDVVLVRYEDRQVTAAAIRPLQGLTSLRGLVLKGAAVTDATLVHLNEQLSELEYLELNNTQVTDAGLVHLRALTQLKHLELINTQVTDAGLEHLKGMAKLQALCLGNTQVTDEGRQRLRDALPRCVIAP